MKTLEMAERHPELVVAGIIIEPRHYRAFELFARGFKTPQISEKLIAEGYENCSVSAIRNWQQLDWHHTLCDRHLGVAQKKFVLGMADFQEEILEAYKNIVRGVDKEDRTAKARVQAISKFMESGPMPPLNKRTNIEINNDNRTQILKIDQDKLRMKTQEELQDILEAGEVPDDLLLKK